MTINILNENRVRSTSTRKYTCPYCGYRDTRENLVIHIRDEHEDLIPEDYTAARVVFNMINNKTEGKCIVCRKPTKWNETSWRYDRICSEECKAEYAKSVDKNMINKYGKTHLLNDPEQQKKMLANRSISQDYIFTDGGIVTCTGSYEKNLVEFMDTVLGIPSADIKMPGPVYEYVFEGKKHYWITDIFYIPFNLVFDVKDGGTNPNTHPSFEIDRRKQRAKEDTIIKANRHNYIRLTDNNFEQLLQIMTSIKQAMLDEEKYDKEKIVHINESMIASTSSNNEPYAYLVPYSSNSSKIEGMGVITDLMMPSMFDMDDNSKIVQKPISTFNDKYYAIFETKTSEDLEEYAQLLNESINGTEITDIDHIAKLFLKTPLDRAEDILMHEDVELVTIGYDMSKLDFNQDVADIASYSSIPPADGLIDISSTVDGLIDGIVILEDEDGVYAKCEKNDKRSPYYRNVDSIPKHIMFLLRRM